METVTWQFCLRSDYLKDSPRIYSRVWIGDTGLYTGHFASLSVLISPEGNRVQEIGYKGKRIYEDLKAINEHKCFYYFEKVVLQLVKALSEVISIYFV